MLREAVKINQGKAQLEASGGYDITSAVVVAETGVDYISIRLCRMALRLSDLRDYSGKGRTTFALSDGAALIRPTDLRAFLL